MIDDDSPVVLSDLQKISPGAAVLAAVLPEEMFPVPTVIGVGGAAEILCSQKGSLLTLVFDLIRDELLERNKRNPSCG